jgi:hypothetical protein
VCVQQQSHEVIPKPLFPAQARDQKIPVQR